MSSHIKAEHIIQAATEAGVSFQVQGDTVRIKADHRPPEDLLRQLRQHKDDIRFVLTRRLPGNASSPMGQVKSPSSAPVPDVKPDATRHNPLDAHDKHRMDDQGHAPGQRAAQVGSERPVSRVFPTPSPSGETVKTGETSPTSTAMTSASPAPAPERALDALTPPLTGKQRPACGSGLSDQFAAVAGQLDALVSSTTEDEVADAKVRYWRRQLELMPRPADNRLAAIVARCRALAFEAFIRDAARQGWSERDLFGWAGPHAKAGHGLVVGLALTTRKSGRVISIASDYAVIKSDGGTRIQVPRRSEHPPIWT